MQRRKASKYRSVGPNEHEIQSSFFDWLAYQKDERLKLFYAIPNGANKSYAAAAKFKREGLKKGVPDCHLPVPSNGYNGLWIEFKSKRGVVSDEQRQWLNDLEDAGHRATICRSLEHAIETVQNYLSNGKNGKTNG